MLSTSQKILADDSFARQGTAYQAANFWITASVHDRNDSDARRVVDMRNVEDMRSCIFFAQKTDLQAVFWAICEYLWEYWLFIYVLRPSQTECDEYLSANQMSRTNNQEW